jgi:hypothetical protein
MGELIGLPSTGVLRFEVQGIVGGDPVVVVEHDTRIHADAAPSWPRCLGGDNCYRVILEGRPRSHASSTWRTSTMETAA